MPVFPAYPSGSAAAHRRYARHRPARAAMGRGGERGSGCICLNGAAARKVQVGDTVIIIAYSLMTEEEAKTYVPKVVMVDENNHPINVRGTEKEAEIG